MSVESVIPSNHLVLCCSLLFLPSIFSRIGVFFNESALLIRWPEYWSFSVSISPSSEYWGLISFRVDWYDLLAVQETLKNLLQRNSKASILQHSAFFMDHWRIDTFKLWCWRTLEKLLESKEIKPVNPKGNQLWIFMKELMLKLKIQYFGHLMLTALSLENTLIPRKTEGRRRRWQKMR